MTRTALLTPPSMCFTTLFTNLPTILNGRNHTPVIIMDAHDIERLHGRIVRERGNKGLQIRGMIADSLIRRGILKPIDYGKYYTARRQRRNMETIQRELEKLSNQAHENAMETSAEVYNHFHRGDYQRPFREALGTWNSSINQRNSISSYKNKVERGLGDPEGWNDRILAKYLAALEVRYRANKKIDLNIVKVIGQGDQHGLAKLISESDLDFKDHIARIKTDSDQHSIQQIYRPNTEKTARSHRIFEDISTTAQKITGVESNEWYSIGSRLAAPILPDLFTRLDGFSSSRYSHDEIDAQTRDILNRLDRRASDNDINHVQYRAEKIAEQREGTNQQTKQTANRLKQSADLSNYSSGLRDLVDDGHSPEATFLAASIKMDPHHRYHKDDVFRRSVQLKRQLKHIEVSNEELDNFKTRGSVRTGGKQRNWHQQTERKRKPINYSF